MIIYEDKYIYVVHKPSGIATQTSALGEKDIVSMLKNHAASKNEQTYIGVIHRLDQPVEGLLVFARDKNAANKLSAQLRDKTLQKSYLAIVSTAQSKYPDILEKFDNNIDKENNHNYHYKDNTNKDNEFPENRCHTLTDYIISDKKTNTSRIADMELEKNSRANKGLNSKPTDIKPARLRFLPVGMSPDKDAMLIRVYIDTGRRHQIRVQMANAGMALLGDCKYGSGISAMISSKYDISNTALVADRLSFIHPADGKRMDFKINPPSCWSKAGVFPDNTI